ncbi:MAG: HAMP domain-containing histidine kinase [Solirubrobacterales bacterium]|nr:HAMP domain-containing histidine kinase [Solirubrobacterales bacterium]MBV8948272.1 HAMP domain-containing histidine kinase [Solirubrobacterales bacterium]
MRVGDVSLRLPAPTIRLRMALLYGIVFLVTGAVLLTIGYELVYHNLNGSGTYRSELRKLGLAPPRLPPAFAPGSPGERFANAVRAELRADVAQLRADAVHRLLVEYVVALGAMTMVSVAAGWLLAGRALRPLRRITATAQRVSGENLGERIGLRGPADELKELADTFDGMLIRLDGAFASQRHFVANASHELRTPLAIMRTELDVTLADPDASVQELRRMGEAVRDTVDRCERLIEGLLMLARSEAGTGRDEAADLAALAADCITDLRARAEEARVEVRDDLSPAWARGGPALLERMIANLIDNGIRYNEPGGWLRVSTRSEDGLVRLTVANGGPRIEPGLASTLTEPFRRLDRGAGGFGLGLSIVRSVAEAHGGAVEVSAPAEGGLSVRIELPAMPAPAVGIVPKRGARALTQS